MQDAKKKKERSSWLYGKLDRADKLTNILAELLEDEPDFDSIVAELVGCSMCDVERGDYTVDENGDDLGDSVGGYV